MTPGAEGPQDATPATRAHQRAVLDTLPFGDVQDFEDAGRGFVATLPEVSVRNWLWTKRSSWRLTPVTWTLEPEPPVATSIWLGVWTT